MQIYLYQFHTVTRAVARDGFPEWATSSEVVVLFSELRRLVFLSHLVRLAKLEQVRCGNTTDWPAI